MADLWTSRPERGGPGGGGLAKGFRARAADLFLSDEVASVSKTSMTRLRGRSLRGKRLRRGRRPLRALADHDDDLFPPLRWLDGLPRPSREPPTRKSSAPTCEKVLVPTLRPGDLVVMDNLTPHKVPQTLALIPKKPGPKPFSCPPIPARPQPAIENLYVAKVKNSVLRSVSRPFSAEELA